MTAYPRVRTPRAGGARTSPTIPLALALLLAASAAHAGSTAVADIDLSRIQVFAPVLGGFPITGQSSSSVTVGGMMDAEQIATVGNTDAMVFKPLEHGRAATMGVGGGFPTGGAARTAAQADGVTKSSTLAMASGQMSFSFISGSGCTTVRVEVDYAMIHRVLTFPGPERGLADQSISVRVDNIDLGFVSDTDSIRVIHDLVSGGAFESAPSGTLIATVPCAGTNSIQGVVQWGATALAMASSPFTGQAPSNPILPTSVGVAGAMSFEVTVPNGGAGTDFPLYFDPPAATGYAYAVGPGDPKFASVVVPAALPVTGDSQFRVLFSTFDLPLAAGTELFFTAHVPGGVDGFQIVDIDPAEDLDPNDPLAFVTGLTFATSGPVTMTMTPLVPCGNGMPDPGEDCDDAGESTTCDADCSFASCGDGTLNATALEACDDGDVGAGDGCDGSCQVEDGFDCSGAPSVCTTTCGDGIPAGAEECDDGNLTSGDGCQATCLLPACGDGVLDAGEGCDDGDLTSEDGCSSACVVESCGDGVVQGGLGEACDDGAGNSDTTPDACRTDCTAARCGDLVVDADETCDDGDAAGGDGCSAACQEEPLDHFVLYKAKPARGGPGFAARGPIVLADQFRTADYTVVKPLALALPADKNGEGVADATTHLVELALKPARGVARFRAEGDVHVTNQCSDLLVQVTKPVGLLVPAAKGFGSPEPAPHPDDHDRDHFLCYQAKLQRKAADGSKLPAFSKNVQVEVADQLQARRYDLKKLTRLCTPTAKSGTPVFLAGPDKGQPAPLEPAVIRNPDEHLVCYQAKLAKRLVPQSGCGPAGPDAGTKLEPKQAKHEPRRVFVTSQLGTQQLDTTKELELCVPSAVER